MGQRGLFWPDVQAAIENARDVRSQGLDDDDRTKWIIAGEAAYGGAIEIVCVVEVDESETEFVTLFWEN
jgi:hypothetical protein